MGARIRTLVLCIIEKRSHDDVVTLVKLVAPIA